LHSLLFHPRRSSPSSLPPYPPSPPSRPPSSSSSSSSEGPLQPFRRRDFRLEGEEEEEGGREGGVVFREWVTGEVDEEVELL